MSLTLLPIISTTCVPGWAFTAALGLNANTETLTANKTLVDGDEPIQYLDPSASAFTVELPAEGSANHIFYFVNTSTSDNLESQDDGAVTIVTILPGMSAIVVSDGTSWKPIIPEVLDEDDFASDSDTKVPTQQSVKAYGNATYAVKEQKKSVSILLRPRVRGMAQIISRYRPKWIVGNLRVFSPMRSLPPPAALLRFRSTT